MSWIQAHIIVDQSQVALLELLLNDLGAISIGLSDAGDEPMLEPLPGETPLWSAVKVSGLFADDQDIDQLRGELERCLAQDISRHLTLEKLLDDVWERRWLTHFRPMQFGQRICIHPTIDQSADSCLEQPDSVVINLDPGLAFGTGTHPTTRLCLEWLDQADIQGKPVIDFGCGSGILAITALKLGAASVIGIDHDPQARLASRANAEQNKVAERLQLASDFTGVQVQADVILANILANVLLDMSQTLLARLKPGGELVMSGILSDQVDALIAHYGDHASVIQIQQQAGWCLLHVRKTA